MPAAADGSVVFSTELDESGLKSGLSKLSSVGGKWAKGFGVMIGGVSTALLGLAKMGMQYNSQMENYQTNFAVLLGDEAKALDYVALMREKAAKTPFGMEDLASASQTMLSFGMSAEDSMKYMDMLGDISLGNKDKLGSLSLAFSQVSSAGKLTGQDLLQMINSGFNPLTTIAEKTGASIGDLKAVMAGDKASDEFVALLAAAEKEVETLGDNASDSAKMLAQIGREGMISADMVAQAMEIETSAGGRFYQGMLKASETMSGMISTLKDDAMNLVGNVFAPLSAAFAENVLPLASGYLTSLTEAFEQGGTSGLIDELGTVLGDVLTRASQSLPNTLKVATNIVGSIAKAAVKNAPKIIAGLGSSASALLGSISDLLPELMSSAADALPSLVPILAGALSDMVYSLASNADDFLVAGGKLALSLVDGIIKSLPVLGSGLLDALTALFTNTDEIAAESSRLVDEYFGATLDAYDAFKQSIAAADKKYEDTVSDIELKEQTAKNLLDYYDQLNAIENPTEEDLTAMAAVAAQVVELYPQLAEYIDPVTNTFTANTQAIRDNIDAFAEQARAAAYYDLLKEKFSELAGLEMGIAEGESSVEELRGKVEQLSQLYNSIISLVGDLESGVYDSKAQSLYDQFFAIDPENISGWQQFFQITDDGKAIFDLLNYDYSSIQTGLLSSTVGLATDAEEQLSAFSDALSTAETNLASIKEQHAEVEKEISQHTDLLTTGDEPPLTKFVNNDVDGAKAAYEGAPDSLLQKANRAKALLRAKLAIQEGIGSATKTAVDASDESGEYTAYGEEVAGYVADGLAMGAIELADAGRKAMLAYAQSIEAEQSSVQAAGQKAVQGLVSSIEGQQAAVQAAGRSVGQAMASAAAEGVNSGIGGVSSSLSRGISEAQSSAASQAQQFRDVGYQISAGMAQGVRNGSGVLIDAVTDVIDEALNAARRKAQINSPARLFADKVGVYIPPGIAMGVEESAYVLNNSVQNMIDDSLPDMSNYGGGLGSWQRVQQLAGGGNSVNQTINFNQPIQTPDEVAQAMYEIATFPMAGEVIP